MGKFALLAALLVASAGALNIPDALGEEHGDDAVFETHYQQVLGQHHLTEHVQDTYAAQLVGLPAQLELCMNRLKPGGPWHPGPIFTNLTIYEALSADEQ